MREGQEANLGRSGEAPREVDRKESNLCADIEELLDKSLCAPPTVNLTVMVRPC